jgi:hypothetical protein
MGAGCCLRVRDGVDVVGGRCGGAVIRDLDIRSKHH